MTTSVGHDKTSIPDTDESVKFEDLNESAWFLAPDYDGMCIKWFGLVDVEGTLEEFDAINVDVRARGVAVNWLRIQPDTPVTPV